MRTKYPPKVSQPTVNRNLPKNGIELRFPSDPGTEVRELMKERGFNFSPWGTANKFEDPFWYVRYTDEKMKFAEKLVNLLVAEANEKPEAEPAIAA
jgi:hypothetical protein